MILLLSTLILGCQNAASLTKPSTCRFDDDKFVLHSTSENIDRTSRIGHPSKRFTHL